MKLVLCRNKRKVGEIKPKTWDEITDPDYLVYQAQRTGADDGSPAYETVEVGVGYKMLAPSGETYIEVKVFGLTDNKPKKNE